MSIVTTIKSKLETIVGDPLNGSEGEYFCIECDPIKEITDEIKSCWLQDPYDGHRVETGHTKYRHITDYEVIKSIDPSLAIIKLFLILIALMAVVFYLIPKLLDTLYIFLIAIVILLFFRSVYESIKVIDRSIERK